MPASIYSDGGDRQVAITVTGISDRHGQPVLDGTKVVVSTLGGCSHLTEAGECIQGAGGTINTGMPRRNSVRLMPGPVFTL